MVNLDRPIFVVGHPRSGTTLLASMLGRHPDIASTPESLYLTQARFELYPLSAGGPQRLAEKIMASPLVHLVRDPQTLAQTLKAHWPLDERALFTLLLDAFRAAEDKPRVLEKSPLHLRHLNELARWYGDARIIWILRDPRACVASLIKVPFATSNPTVLARQWARNVEFGLSARLPERMLTRVRYEDLIADPEPHMRALCDFVEVPFDERLFDHTAAVRTVKAVETWKDNVAKPVMADRARAWQSELDPKVQARVTAITRPKLAALGYDAGSPGGGLDARLAGLRSQLLYSPAMIKAMQAAYPKVRYAQQRIGRPPRPNADWAKQSS